MLARVVPDRLFGDAKARSGGQRRHEALHQFHGFESGAHRGPHDTQLAARVMHVILQDEPAHAVRET